MESFSDYLDMLDELLETSKSAPFSSKLSVDKIQINDLISEMRMNLPIELRQAKRIIEDHDKIVIEARAKAERIIEEGQQIAQSLADKSEVMQIATEQAERLMAEARNDAKDMRLGAVEYADEVLSVTETAIRESLNSLNTNYRAIEDNFMTTIDILYKNRQELRGNKNG